MKTLSKLLLASVDLFLFSCIKLDYKNLKKIDLFDYQIEVPLQFENVKLQGIDSYVGKIVGEGIEISYDYGMYTGPEKNLDPDKFDEYLETFGSVKRQIVVAKNPSEEVTNMHIIDMGEPASPGGTKVSLKMYASNITLKE